MLEVPEIIPANSTDDKLCLNVVINTDAEVKITADLCHAEVGRVGVAVGSEAVLQGDLLALQRVHQISEFRG